MEKETYLCFYEPPFMNSFILKVKITPHTKANSENMQHFRNFEINFRFLHMAFHFQIC